MITAITPVIIARDSSATIRKTLSGLSAFAEVIVYDNGSTDGTQGLCREFPNVRLVEGHFDGFGPTKNRAALCASTDWVFSLDSDEWPSEELVEEIRAIDTSEPKVCFAVIRHNLFCGRHVRRGGWGNDRLLRIYHRDHTRFNDVAVHEKLQPGNSVRSESLSGALWHDAIVEIDQFLKKISHYSELAARHNPKRRKARSMTVILLRSGWAFLRSYVFQLGFLEGWRGVVIAYAGSCGTFFRYAKLYAQSRSAGPTV